MTAITKTGTYGGPFSKLTSGRYNGKTIATAFQQAILIQEFDLWREGYAGAVVEILKEGTTTKASVYTDLNLSSITANPQVLITKTVGTVTFGKFETSVYTPDAYYLRINGVESTGVFYPGLRTLQNEDASGADVKSSKGGIARELDDRAGDTIHVLDFGNFLQTDGSSTQNTATLTAAIGVASAANGGEVILPAGTYQISTISLPANVVIRGQGMNATVIQSRESGNVVTVTGSDAGLADMTLDGVNLTAGSVGLYGVGKSRVRLTQCVIKRFETGVKMRGGADHHYTNLFVDSCLTGLELRGDTDATSTAGGSAFTDLTWNGGAVTNTTVQGLYLRYIDAVCQGLTIRDINFTSNVGTAALNIEGAQQIIFEDLIFTGNTVRHILTADVTANTVENIDFLSCEWTDSEIKLGGSCKDCIFDRPIFAGVLSVNLNNPTFPIMVRDSREASTITLAGNTEKLTRWNTINSGTYKGQTTATVTVATVFRRVLNPGEIINLDVRATAVQENSAGYGTISKTACAYQPGAQLNFVAQTGNFALGQIVTGGTSGAKGLLQAQTDAGVTGTLNLIRVSGTFQNNEALTDPLGGAATAQGAITLQNSLIIVPVQTDYFAQSAGATSWDVDVTTTAQEVQVKARGVTTGTVDWVVAVRANIVT